jgi:hypothetical protein
MKAAADSLVVCLNELYDIYSQLKEILELLKLYLRFI